MALPVPMLQMLVVSLAVAPLAAVTACAHAPCPAEVPVPLRSRMDAGMARQIQEQPDSVVGVLVRTTRPATPADRRALADAGLQVGTVAGEILTGRLRACDALRVLELDFVRYVELAREVPRPPLP
jgi:hypothetical protein